MIVGIELLVGGKNATGARETNASCVIMSEDGRARQDNEPGFLSVEAYSHL